MAELSTDTTPPRIGCSCRGLPIRLTFRAGWVAPKSHLAADERVTSSLTGP